MFKTNKKSIKVMGNLADLIAEESTKSSNIVSRLIALDESDATETRDISFEDAEEEIARYFREHDGERIDCGDLMEELNIAPGLIMRVCDKLEEEKKIAPVD